MLARSKFNSIESKISEALMNNQISGSKKSKYIKEQEAKGLLSNLGIRTPLSKIPIFGDVLF